MGGKEKLHCGIIPVIIADGWNLLLLIMFKFRTVPECIKLPAGICICVQEDDWMDNVLMQDWNHIMWDI